MALVTYILGDCPGCGARNKFGNVDVYSAYIFRGCGVCRYNEHIPLPKLKKKVLYLDQFFFSHAFRGKDERFIDAARRIRKLTYDQQLVVPFSSIHEEETHQWDRYAELMDFIKATSGGHEFAPAYEVESTQMNKAIAAWSRQQAAAYVRDPRDVLHDDIHVWDGYLRIDVGGYLGNRDHIRQLKTEAIDALANIFEGWRTSTNTFEQDVLLEHDAAAKGYVNSYVKYVGRLAAGDFMAAIDSPIVSQVIESMLYQFPKKVPQKDRYNGVLDFLSSDHFYNLPFHDIEARMFATLKFLVKGGAYPVKEAAVKKLSGFYYDVKHIATYAPYCDAILIDAPMHEIVGRQQVDLAGRYGTKVFSRSNWDEFLAWLDDLGAEMTPEHREGIELAYLRH